MNFMDFWFNKLCYKVADSIWPLLICVLFYTMKIAKLYVISKLTIWVCILIGNPPICCQKYKREIYRSYEIFAFMKYRWQINQFEFSLLCFTL